MDRDLERIISFMKEKGIKQKELTASLGLKESAFSEWKKGKTHSYRKYMKEIAAILGVREDEILFDEIPSEKRNLLPIYGMVSCGTGCNVMEEVIGYETADSQYNESDYFWLQAEGDSMYPKIMDGDLVLVKRQTSVDVGDTAVLVVDEEEGYLKKVNYTDTRIELHSFNPFYQPIVFEGRNVTRVRVIGKVVELKRRF